MIYLIIALAVLLLIAIRQTAKARRWKRKNKEIYRSALRDQHSLQHQIEELQAGRT